MKKANLTPDALLAIMAPHTRNFVRELIPNKRERQIFWDWAAKREWHAQTSEPFPLQRRAN